jgi:predicted alpha/beta-hydrolase family hydrolase
LAADGHVTFGNNLNGILTGQADRGAVLISHGAGGNMVTPLLVQTAAALNENGFLTLRWNFGYVEAGRAPSAGGKKELPEMAAAVDFLTERAGKAPLILLGKSFGGRLSTHIAAQRVLSMS